MARWRKQIRLALIAVAGFVLLVTVLPQVASGIGLGALAGRLDGAATCGSSGPSGSTGSSGSSGTSSSDSSDSCCSGSSGSSGSDASGSGSGSSGCDTGPGTVTGTVSVTGAPSGAQPSFVGVGACPEPDPGEALCAFPQYALATGGSYSLSLAPGSWIVWGFYEVAYGDGAFLGSPTVVTVSSGATDILDTTVPYVRPATVDATLTVTGLPAGVPLQSASLVLCPVGIPYGTLGQPLPCASTTQYVAPGSGPATITLTGLPAGQWTAYPSYCTEFGCTTPTAVAKVVTTRAGRTTRVKLTTPYQVPPNGLVNATVTVTGAPSGFADPTGVYACQVALVDTMCEGGQTGGGPDPLFLTDGTWVLVGYYTVSPFGNAVLGPEEIVTVRGGQTTDLTLAVPYQVLGAVTGSIRITGRPGGVHPTGYWVSACPSGSFGAPLGDPLGFLSCVYEYSGSAGATFGTADPKRFGRRAHRATVHEAPGSRINSIDLPTLTPGRWDISVGYSTIYGSFGSGQTYTVDVTAGGTTKAKVTIPYVPPFQGVVTGKIAVVGAPGGGTDASVMACSTQPVAGTCTDEVDAFVNSDGTYQLTLFPGTWWVQGVDYVYEGSTTEAFTSAPHQESVGAGQRDKLNLTVPVVSVP